MSNESDNSMNDYFRMNKQLWNKLAEINPTTEFYDIAGFKAGKLSLMEPELAELGDVNGKSLLHLQCHFGLDALSLARLGAHVVGVDFSDVAIDFARNLGDELKIDARFICSNIMELDSVLDEQFDVVFTSYGVLGWLPDLKQWAKVIKRYLNSDGIFYIVEFHPFLYMLDENTGANFKYPYFHKSVPLELDSVGSYADRNATISQKSYEWTHSLSDIINALLSVGMKIECIHEFPYSPYNCFPFFEEKTPGRWIVRNQASEIPLMFSIRATL